MKLSRDPQELSRDPEEEKKMRESLELSKDFLNGLYINVNLVIVERGLLWKTKDTLITQEIPKSFKSFLPAIGYKN